jgi:hypothetical protein
MVKVYIKETPVGCARLSPVRPVETANQEWEETGWDNWEKGKARNEESK